MSKKNSNTRRVLFKDLPSVDELYQALDIKSISYPRDIIKKTFLSTLASIRKDIELGKIDKDIRQVSIDRAREKLDKLLSFNLNNIINGTGIVLHTGLGRSPLSKKIVIESFDRIYPYSNLEFDVENNLRGDRNTSIQNLINPLMGSQKAIVVNNCAAAVLLSLNTISENKEIIIS